MKRSLLATVVVASVALAQDAGTRAPIQVHAADVRFATSPRLPKTIKIARLEGDLMQPGPFTVRLQFAPKYRLELHTHPHDERVTVLEGAVVMKVQGLPPKKLPAGSYYVTPAGMPHELSSEGGATVQVTGVGPWSVSLVRRK